jgi:peptidoglycan/xylan/chitin deacetylase (PgdA/CDA1 family)
VNASFFFTGRFYRNPSFQPIIQRLRRDGHYLGAHSNDHLLYNDWTRRDSLLVSRDSFARDLEQNYAAMAAYGIQKEEAPFFLPPYEWYNDTIARWTGELGLQLVNYTPGTLSHADYTTPAMKNYRPSEVIFRSIVEYEGRSAAGLNGFVLLLHVGTDPARTDKFYHQLPQLLGWLKKENYRAIRIDKLFL